MGSKEVDVGASVGLDDPVVRDTCERETQPTRAGGFHQAIISHLPPRSTKGSYREGIDSGGIDDAVEVLLECQGMGEVSYDINKTGPFDRLQVFENRIETGGLD